MATSPPASPGNLPPRPLSAMVRSAPRSTSRLSMSSKAGGGSRASDEDARTAVRVAVRVRPPLQPTDPGFDLIPQRFQRSMVQVNTPTSLAIDSPQGRKLFVFDRVFSEEISQAGIWEYLHESVSAFLQGYNVSLLAYGQSGAGKSYTMGTAGPLDVGHIDSMGVIPRAATALFEKLDGGQGNTGASKLPNPTRSSMSQLRSPAKYSQSNLNKDRSWVLKATYVEIYNETLRDLLVPDNTPAHERGTVTIREDVKGNILLTGLRQVEIHSVDDMMNALNFGSTIRQTDSTAINAKSSRSHAVFSLNLIQRKTKLQTASGQEKRFSMPIEAMTGIEMMVTTDSKMHFVDLAGSERLKNTGAQGERAKEGISINAGLAALGKVISQLSSRNPGAHVSYRDSKLTRLLQDSLGGNAITYMIACVTPAEFHLSETLNTVQYAQRARAIQSKPRIQALEEGDKQGQIDRLKAEVAFLREQIQQLRNGGGTDGRSPPSGDRLERNGNKEVTELQNQLLDAQENYSTLSQRHARLIAEMAKARDNEIAESHQFEETLDDSATERLNRSNSFAQAVEQVVLEYEKTIQTLEQSLSNTRTTLSSTETSLLEKETKCAYMDTVNSQLQARLQKMMDREASTENYLHDLENKLDGHTSGEEKNTAIITELRKEIARVRENEASCEDYISTLEERLAEADQDAELMQREMDRLEQVIERQRSLGKLDSLLYELDHIQQDTKEISEQVMTNGTSVVHRHDAFEQRSRSQSQARSMAQQDVIPEIGEEDEEDAVNTERARDAARSALEGETKISPQTDDHLSLSTKPVDDELLPQSPAQSKFVADKLESVTQELVDLRVEHENTVNEFELLHAKYEQALQSIAEMQDVVDEAKHNHHPRDSMLSISSPVNTRPSSFMTDPSHGRQYSSRSLSSELSSAMASPVPVESSETETIMAKPMVAIDGVINGSATQNEADSRLLEAEVERFKQLDFEKGAIEKELNQKYAELETKYQETLDIVEELKTEVSKAKMSEVTSPRTSTPVIRRKSSQNVMIIDRAHRSFASLRNIAAENFEDRPDVMQNFELNLNSAIHELHTRSERIQELEVSVNTAKKEMEAKMAIISGLTRERSSMKASPVDISVVSTLKDQLEKNETQLKRLQESHASREKELMAEIDSLRTSILKTPMPTEAAPNLEQAAISELTSEQRERIAQLETELSSWENRHQTALSAMEETEAEMMKTIEDLESQIVAANHRFDEMIISNQDKDEESKQLHNKHQNLVNFLRSEIDEYKAIINSNATKVAELEAAHNEAQKGLEEVIRDRDGAIAESGTHKMLIAKLQTQILDHEQTIKSFEQKMLETEVEHSKQKEALKTTSAEEYQSQLDSLASENADKIRMLERDLHDAREELTKIATQVAFALGLETSMDKITERIEELAVDHKALIEERSKSNALQTDINELLSINSHVVRELEAVKTTLTEMLTSDNSPVKSPNSVDEQLAAVQQKMWDLETRSKKNSRIVEELENQLNSNFEQAQITNNRLSTLTERNTKLEEASVAMATLQSELDTIKEDYAVLQAKYEEVIPAIDSTPRRSNSNSSNLHKSTSVGSLPSPPPSVPLPPLPGGAPGNVPSTPTGVRPPSKDLAISQIQEDQEARIKSLDKQLTAEKQLTQTLEEALTDLETNNNKVKADADAWKRKCIELETENKELRDKPQQDQRWSLQAVEEERKKRMDAELARARMEERMNALNVAKKKKKGSLNCF